MPNLRLIFVSGNTAELVQTEYDDGSNFRTTSVRGKTPGAHRGAGTFQWTTAVKAMSVVLLRARLQESAPSYEAVLLGGGRSLASSLDYALSKEPSWLGEMFGFMRNGRVAARRFFLVTNPNRKRPGPVAIALNLVQFAPGSITILLDGKVVTDAETLARMIGSIEGEVAGQTARLRYAA